MNISAEGLDLIRRFEGLVDGDPDTPGLQPYKDPIKIWTIGYGRALRYPAHTGRYLRGDKDRKLAMQVYPGGITEAQALEFLDEDVDWAEGAVRRLVKTRRLKQGQFDGLVSWVFNLGEGSLKSSTLLKMVRAKEDAYVPREMTKWVHAGGKPLRGLARRRTEEALLYIDA